MLVPLVIYTGTLVPTARACLSFLARQRLVCGADWLSKSVSGDCYTVLSTKAAGKVCLGQAHSTQCELFSLVATVFKHRHCYVRSFTVYTYSQARSACNYLS
jgi:hypothetical protein